MTAGYSFWSESRRVSPLFSFSILSSSISLPPAHACVDFFFFSFSQATRLRSAQLPITASSTTSEKDCPQPSSLSLEPTPLNLSLGASPPPVLSPLLEYSPHPPPSPPNSTRSPFLTPMLFSQMPTSPSRPTRMVSVSGFPCNEVSRNPSSSACVIFR